ncbi:MAG: hypothetical protein NC087_06625 [Anaeroplasma bactoclasticum]|nr:hypothetical protein [Anaeroplasma bactoclasticum]
MILALSIIFILLESGLIITYGYLCFKNRSFISKNMSGFIIPVAILSFCIISLGYASTNHSYGVEGVSKSVEYAASLFVYSIKVEHIKGLVFKDVSYTICYIGIVFLSMFTSTATILGLCKNAIINFFRVSKRKFKGTDIVVGYGPKALEYVRNTKNSILWIHKPIRMNKDFILKELYVDKVPYVLCNLNTRSIKSFIWRRNKDYNFIFFKEDSILDYNTYIEFFKNSKIKNKNIKVYFEGSKNEISYLNDLLSRVYSDASNMAPILYCFDLYEKLARKFNWEHTIAESLPNGFIKDDGTISKNKKVNVIFLGFGKTNSALFETMVMNNQFATYCEEHYEVKPVHYHLYDLDKESFNNITIRRLEENYYCKNNQDKFAKIEKLCELQYKAENIMSREVQKDLNDIVNEDDAFTMLFVGYSEDLDNIAFSKSLVHLFGNKQMKIFCNVDDAQNVDKIENNKIEVYGLKKNIFSHDGIVDDDLLTLAKLRNDNYNFLSNTLEENWAKLSYIKKYSNLYSILSLRFKLNLMGLTLTNTFDVACEEPYRSIYLNLKPELKEYSNYFNHNLRSTIGFCEHLRWCAFYYLNGYDTLKHTDCYEQKVMKGGKEKLTVVTKDEDNKFHAYLLSFYGIDHLHHYLVETFNNVYPTINDVETYQYDYELCDTLLDDLKKLKESKCEYGIEFIKKRVL